MELCRLHNYPLAANRQRIDDGSESMPPLVYLNTASTEQVDVLRTLARARRSVESPVHAASSEEGIKSNERLGSIFRTRPRWPTWMPRANNLLGRKTS